MPNFRSKGGKCGIPLKIGNNDHLSRNLDFKPAIWFLKQVKTHMQNFRSKHWKMWISVKKR